MKGTNSTLSFIKNLHTTRQSEFSDQIIPDSDIDAIKQAITHTANTSNRQIYSIITLNKSQMAILGNKKGSHAFIFCVDFSRMHSLANILSKKFDSSHLTQLLSGIIDVSLLAQSTIISARSLGIDSLITNELYLESRFDLFKKLGIPTEHCIPVIIIYLGYETHKERKQKGRLPNRVVFHDGVYHPQHETDLNEMIEMYDNESNNLCINYSWKKMGYSHYLEWFFEKWSMAIGTKKSSEKFIKELKARKML